MLTCYSFACIPTPIFCPSSPQTSALSVSLLTSAINHFLSFLPVCLPPPTPKSRQNIPCLTPLNAALTNDPTSVASKGVMGNLTPLEAILTKTRGGATSRLLLNRSAMRRSSFSLLSPPATRHVRPFVFTLLQTLLRFFARIENATLFFPISSTLLRKNTGGVGRGEPDGTDRGDG
jgi:hypothetical protein